MCHLTRLSLFLLSGEGDSSLSEGLFALTLRQNGRSCQDRFALDKDRTVRKDGGIMESPEVKLPEVMRRRRAELGMSQAALAKAVGVDVRQIRRYEAGDHQPAFSVAVGIADALGISLDELAGASEYRVDISGDWQACWQSQREGIEDIRIQPVRLRQRGELIQAEALARGRSIEEGGYLWRGELRLWDNEILMGWYAATDGSVRSKGTMYYVMHPHGLSMTGRWVGLSYDGRIVTGWASMAKSEDEARELVAGLKESSGG